MFGQAPLLVVDPSLAAGTPPHRLATAQRDLAVRLRLFDAADGASAAMRDEGANGLGLLVVSGFLLRTLSLEHRVGAEILGPGDLLQPWQDDGEHSAYPFRDGWRVLEPVSAAVLDQGFVGRVASYPQITTELFKRVVRRSRRAAGHMVVSHLASVEHRILISLWHVADEWGRVRADGVFVPVPLTHEQLGLLVGARRPAVTTALGRLGLDGRVSGGPGGFLLRGGVPEDLPLLRGTARHEQTGDHHGRRQPAGG